MQFALSLQKGSNYSSAVDLQIPVYSVIFEAPFTDIFNKSAQNILQSVWYFSRLSIFLEGKGSVKGGESRASIKIMSGARERKQRERENQPKQLV